MYTHFIHFLYQSLHEAYTSSLGHGKDNHQRKSGRLTPHPPALAQPPQVKKPQHYKRFFYPPLSLTVKKETLILLEDIHNAVEGSL